VEEVDDGVEDKDEDVEPELSCLINSAARSDYLISYGFWRVEWFVSIWNVNLERSLRLTRP
jgi:hypothetical protein